jgi:voltage-gated potassium channel
VPAAVDSESPIPERCADPESPATALCWRRLAPENPHPPDSKKPPRPINLPQDRYRLNHPRKDGLLRIGDRPFLEIVWRVLLAIGLVLLVTLITYVGRDGYSDSQGNSPLTFIDSLYYATVSITTTGYGDIVPATQQARLITTLVITPIRVIFLILLIGTTVQVLTARTRFNRRRNKWQKGLTGHTVICGFGIKGRSALKYLEKRDPDNCRAVAIDESEEALEAANEAGAGGVLGSSVESDMLKAAGVEDAEKVIVALDSDDDSVVTVLRARELNPGVTIVASCREQKNEELLIASGADEVIVSSSSAGRILGMAAQAPDAARIVNDLLTFGDGLDINEREVLEAGESLELEDDQTAIAVVRTEGTGTDGEDGKEITRQLVLRPGDAGCEPVQPKDRIIFIDSNTSGGGSKSRSGSTSSGKSSSRT